MSSSRRSVDSMPPDIIHKRSVNLPPQNTDTQPQVDVHNNLPISSLNSTAGVDRPIYQYGPEN